MQIKLKKGVLSRVLRQPSVEGDEREALDQAGAMVVDERLEVGRPLLVPAQGSAPLPTGCVYGCDPVRGSSGVRSDHSLKTKTPGEARFFTLALERLKRNRVRHLSDPALSAWCRMPRGRW